ncbi:MAG: trypsin-like peptidase domain-containing protein [Solirubrobacteraceae bacterium]|nr:trypsin-like peptidase domain-containing protein [Solirubrobacteraceae bacterium]
MNADPRRSNFLAALLGALVIAIPFGGLALAGVFDGSDAAVSDSPSAAAGSPSGAPLAATDVSALYDRVSPGVISVEARAGARGGSGSGFVLDREGFILTNEHVVGGADSVRVRFAEGAPVSARVVGTDRASDLALLKITPGDRELTPLSLGSSEELTVGQPVIAIGSPFGLEGTLTTGVVSALGRSIPGLDNFSIENAVQTDAAINPGNSGGPLIDGAGRVVGVNAQIATATGTNGGVGFAIPIDEAKRILPALKQGRDVERPFLGISTGDAETGTGAVVRETVAGGPAAEAGLRPGDRIVAVAGTEVTRSTDVAPAISSREPGQEVDIRISRGGDERTISVTLGTRPEASSRR